MSRRPYVRPMAGWWKRDPYFLRYMVRDLTAIAVAVYAVVLTVGVLRLAEGEAAWNGWLEALRSPWSLLMHLVLLVSFAVHGKSWFEIMPKSLPVIIGGRRPGDALIARAGWAASVLATLFLLALAWWWRA
jgi:fumarate reductase subunit C